MTAGSACGPEAALAGAGLRKGSATGPSLKRQVNRGMILKLYSISPYKPSSFASIIATYPVNAAIATTPHNKCVNAAIFNDADIANNLL